MLCKMVKSSKADPHDQVNVKKANIEALPVRDYRLARTTQPRLSATDVVAFFLHAGRWLITRGRSAFFAFLFSRMA